MKSVLGGLGTRFLLSFSLILVSFVLVFPPLVQCRSPPSSENIKSLFNEFLNELDDIENGDDIQILEDYKDREEEEEEEEEEAPRENKWFRRDRKSMRCSFHNLCYCRSRMTGNKFCCDCAAGPCFPGNSVVIVEGVGEIPMSNLQIGQKVLAVTTTGEAVYSRVVAFLDRRPRGQAEYFHLTSSEGPNISISANHLVFASNSNNSDLIQARFAYSVQLGDTLYSYKDSNSTSSQVTVHGITRKIEEGAYVPLTEHGTIVVDHILASCYASFGHDVSHLFLTPVRWFPNLFNPGTSQPTGVMGFVTFMKMFGRALSKIPGLVESSENEVEIVLNPNLVTKQP